MTCTSPVLARVTARGRLGIRLGLGRTRAILGVLGDPQAQLRGVLIGGTNGKGSTQALVAGALRAAGLHVGQAPKPHLSDYRERILVDGRPIASGDLDAALEEVLAAADRVAGRHGPATEFELLTAAAFLHLARQRVALAVVEVGLGGRLDATNAWDGGVAAVTNVGLDHQDLLGPDLVSIAREKAAIIKRGDRAVTGAEGAALSVIRRRASRVGASLRVVRPLVFVGLDVRGTELVDDEIGPLRIGLLGRHQAQNAAVALGILRALGEVGLARVDEAALRTGLASARWPGRLELLSAEGVSVLLDGAHNPDGAAALATAVEDLRSSLPGGRASLLLAILADKDVSGMLDRLAESPTLADADVTVTEVPGTSRTLAAEALAAAWAQARGARHRARSTREAGEALDLAIGSARRDGGPLIVAGSLYLVGWAREALLERRSA